MPSDYSPQVRCAGSAQFFIAVSFKMHWNSVNEAMLPERSALSCFSFTAQFQVPAYSITFSAYEFPRNVPPFTGTFPHLAALPLAQLSARTRIDKRRKRSRPGFEPRGGMGRRDDLHDETQRRRASSERARAFQWSIPRLAQLESSNPPK
jgi:hypothetical protein